jgi:myosin heavy subunit
LTLTFSLFLVFYFRPADFCASAGIQKGETKVFLRQTAFDFMEKFRNELLTTATIKIQSVVRRFLERCRYLKTLSFVIAGQASARRFLARKYLKEFRQTRASTRLQTYVRLSHARKNYVARKYACKWLQRYYRGFIGRKNYKKFHDKMITEKAANDKSYKSAVAIQCMYRSRVARQVYQERLKIGRRPSRLVLEGKALTEAIKADKLAAVAIQTATNRTKEVDALTTRLTGAKNSAEKAKLALEALKSTKAELAALQAEFEIMKLNAEGAQARAAKLNEENKQLKEKLKSGTFDGTGEAYASQMYDEHLDLKQLDVRMNGMSARSKKSKADVMSLVQSLKILQ